MCVTALCKHLTSPIASGALANRPTLTSNIALIAPIIDECRTEIEHFLDGTLSNYARQLRAGVAKAKWFKEVGKKLQWSMLEAGEVARLRERLGRANAMIQLVYTQAQGYGVFAQVNLIQLTWVELLPSRTQRLSPKSLTFYQSWKKKLRQT